MTVHRRTIASALLYGVLAIGVKDRNRLLIGGEEYEV
jgi:hypothetical protein